MMLMSDMGTTSKYIMIGDFNPLICLTDNKTQITYMLVDLGVIIIIIIIIIIIFNDDKQIWRQMKAIIFSGSAFESRRGHI